MWKLNVVGKTENFNLLFEITKRLTDVAKIQSFNLQLRLPKELTTQIFNLLFEITFHCRSHMETVYDVTKWEIWLDKAVQNYFRCLIHLKYSTTQNLKLRSCHAFHMEKFNSISPLPSFATRAYQIDNNNNICYKQVCFNFHENFLWIYGFEVFNA